MSLPPNDRAILDRITKILKEKKIYKKELCTALHVSSQAYSNWEKGNNSSFLKKLPQIAAFLNVPVDSLLSDDAPPRLPTTQRNKNILPFSKRGMRPIVGAVSAGIGVIAADDVVAWQSVDDKFDRESCFWLQVTGDSMSPIINSGDLILIDKSAQIESGDVVVAIVENDGFIKKVEITDKNISLISYNPYYPPMRFDKSNVDKIYFVGKAVKLERDLL